MSSAATPTSLRARLRAITPAASAMMRGAFAQPLSWAGNGVEFDVAWSDDATPIEAALLDSAYGNAQLWIAASDWRDDAGDRPWQDYEGESRLLAWVLTHESLLRKLGHVLGCDFSVGHLLPAASTRAALHWRLREGERRAGGWIKADPHLWLNHWLPLAQPRRVTRAPTLAATLRTQLEIRLLLTGFPLAELRPCAAGDVLVIGARERAWSALQLARGDARWLAAWSRGQLRVLGALAPLPHLEDATMANDATPEAAGVAAPATAALDALSVDLTLVVGQLSLSLGELAALAPGYVFELPNQLEHAQVLIQSGGRTIGRGELVAVGDTLGVQLTELKFDGPQ